MMRKITSAGPAKSPQAAVDPAVIRQQRQDALTMALSLFNGSTSATDHQAVIQAARDFLAFLDNG